MTQSARSIHVCDGCSSWTAEECSAEECVEEYGWVFEPADEQEPDRWYCPECQ